MNTTAKLPVILFPSYFSMFVGRLQTTPSIISQPGVASAPRGTRVVNLVTDQLNCLVCGVLPRRIFAIVSKARPVAVATGPPPRAPAALAAVPAMDRIGWNAVRSFSTSWARSRGAGLRYFTDAPISCTLQLTVPGNRRYTSARAFSGNGPHAK